MAAIAASTNNLVMIVEMPTGSGKTWIQGLLAVFYANLGMKVTIIEPTEDLRIQATELLGVLDYNISVCSIE